MRSSFRIAMTCFAVGVGLLAPSIARAQAAPAGYIWDVATVNPGTDPAYTQFNTSFVASSTSEYVSFAFRESPAYWAFSNPVVELSGTSTNLLTNPLFQGSVVGQNCNHNNSLGCPVGWGAWIEPIDTSAIGQVAGGGSNYGCNVGAEAGTLFWCDGSVQGYDAIYQGLTSLTAGDTYNVSFYLQDDSGRATTSATSANCTATEGSCVDALVYAGTQLPIGTVNLGPPTVTPEPSSLVLLGTGLLGFARAYRSRRGRKASQAVV